MEVRAARPDEYADAGRVTADAYREFADPDDEEWDQYLAVIEDVAGRAERMPVLVALVDGSVVGSATVEMDDALLGDDDQELPPEAASLRMLGVDPAARRSGAGRALVEGSLEVARAAGKRVMLLRTTGPMVGAQRLYRSMGFERDPERDLTFESGFHMLAYRRPI
jgi:ribosomal protein S18 acetylase RimI-like enzyme